MDRVALITVHGMGRTRPDYAAGLIEAVRRRLDASTLAALHVGSVFYQRELQFNEDALWAACTSQASLNWTWLREFMLFNFADAVGLEAGKDEIDSSYFETQLQIASTLLQAWDELGGAAPMVAVAHSLGGQVLSCYLYDAQREQRARTPGSATTLPPAGIWQDIRASVGAGLGRELSDEQIAFLRGTSLRTLVTTGCNIPVFVAAHNRMRIRPIDKPNPQFEWHNVYSPNDPLGWPLGPLSEDYRLLVSDHRIRAGSLATAWNPLSHGAYWTDPLVCETVAQAIDRVRATPGPKVQ